MTVKKLFEQIRMLGGKRELDSGYESLGVFSAANRALFEVNRLFPVTQKIQLVNYPLVPVHYCRGIRVHKGGEDIQINASGIRSLAFAVSGGAGRARIYAVSCSDSGEEILTELKSFEWDPLTSFEVKKCICSRDKEQIRIVFDGEFNYLVKDVSMYGELVGEREDDIEIFSEWVKYDLSEIKYAGARFMAFASTPVRFNRVSLNSPYDYKIEGSAIYLRSDKPGVYELEYMQKPQEIRNEDDGEIEIEAQLCDLVALRAAYYLYSMTDEEIAEKRNNEYNQLLAVALANARKIKTQNGYRDRKGW